MTIIKKIESDPDNYTVTIVPRKVVNEMTATIREKMSNNTNIFFCSTSNQNGLSIVTINDFVPIENAKYELILSFDDVIIWQGQIVYIA